MNIDKKNSFYLFAEPSFISGMARTADMGATLQIYNESETEDMADEIALKRDWFSVGRDIKNSMEAYEQKKSPAVASATARACC